MREYQVCNQCVVDTIDSKVVFDDKGICDHCRNFKQKIKLYWNPNEPREKQLQKIAAKSARQAEERNMIASLD